MTPVSFVKATESYVKTTEYTRFVDWVTIWIHVVHLLERTKTGLITTSGQTVRAVYSCNSLFVVTFQRVRLQPGKIQTYFIHK